MRQLARAYWSSFQIAMAVQLQYRVAMIIWMIYGFERVIYLVVWTTIARAQRGVLDGFTTSDFAAYFVLMLLVNHLTTTWDLWEFEPRIRLGTFSAELLRPIHPIHSDVAMNIAHKLMGLPVMLTLVVGLGWAFDARLHPPGWAIVAFVPAIMLAVALRFIAEWTVALAVFWTTRIIAINQIYYSIHMFLTGRMAPLALMPDWLQTLGMLLPFRWMMGFPVELLMGRLTPREAWIGLGAQAVWIVLSLSAMRLLWRAGLRRYSAVGA